MKAVTGFIFFCFKISEDGDFSHKIKRCLLLVRKAMTNLDRIVKKQRHHFADKGPYSQSYVLFSSHTTERWTVKKAETQELMLSNCGAEEDS